MRRIGAVMLSLGLSFLGWYIFMKSFDVRANFKVNAYPGSVVQVIKTWSAALPDSEILMQDSIFSIHQQIMVEEEKYLYEWNVELVQDSLSKIRLFISHEQLNVWERIKLPFVETKLERIAIGMIRNFRRAISEHLEITRVEISGLVNFDSVFCVCTPLVTSQRGKAYGMMENYSLLSYFVSDNELETAGVPTIEVNSWSMTQDRVKYNFCYPIKYKDSLPTGNGFFYKWITSKQALKATYNGNYITSDRAWFELLYYAVQNDIQIERRPIEVFYDNPNFGGNEQEWKAEIFLPIKTEEP
jgi:effector-binding domain-containing protein